jgi:hypothetical protein
VLSVRYERGFYIPEDDILHSHRRENLKSYIVNEVLEASVSYVSSNKGTNQCISVPSSNYTLMWKSLYM